jgi:hypothetical protein
MCECVFFVWEFVSILVDNEFGFFGILYEILHTSGTDNNNHNNKVGVIFEPEEVGMKHGENSVEGEGIRRPKTLNCFPFCPSPFLQQISHGKRKAKNLGDQKTKQTDQTHFHPTTLLHCPKSGVQTIVCVCL